MREQERTNWFHDTIMLPSVLLVLVLPTNTTGTGHSQHSKAPPWTRCHRLSWKVAPFWSAVRHCTARTHWVSTFATCFLVCRIQNYTNMWKFSYWNLLPLPHDTRLHCSRHRILPAVPKRSGQTSAPSCQAAKNVEAKIKDTVMSEMLSEMLIRVISGHELRQNSSAFLSLTCLTSWPGTKKNRYPNPEARRFVQTNESSTRIKFN